MSPLGIASTLFNLVSSASSGSASSSSQSRSSSSAKETGDFSSSLALRMASMQAQSINPLLGGVAGPSGAGKGSNSFDFLLSAIGQQSGSNDPLSLLGLSGQSSPLSAMGRNLSLFDPESAYRMMTDINNKDATYKAQFAELSAMKTAVTGMQQAGQALGSVTTLADNDSIKSQLQAFVGKYNEWVGRFDGTVKDGGLLAGTQAAEISLYELKQSIENRFNGAMNGIHGMSDLGVTIDPRTHVASIDSAKFDAAMVHNREGAIQAISEFSGNFAKSAELLVSTHNFIPNRLENLDRVIDYISDNSASLQAEFGRGDAAKPSALVAKALAAYKQMYSA